METWELVDRSGVPMASMGVPRFAEPRRAGGSPTRPKRLARRRARSAIRSWMAARLHRRRKDE